MKKKGFWLVGFFRKGRNARFSIENTRPFEYDSYDGSIRGKVFHGFKENLWATDWQFLENRKIREIDTDKELRKFLNNIWKEWCKKHKRKYTPICTK